MLKLSERLIFLLVLGASLYGMQNIPVAARSRRVQQANPRPRLSQNVSASKPPVLLGLYTKGYAGDQRVIDQELRQIDAWAGKRHTLAGIFMNLEDNNPAFNVGGRLEKLRQNGYTAFINLDTTRTAAQIAKGDIDNSLRKIARAYAAWVSKGEGRIAYIAPLQEMNILGDESYGKDPVNFKLAYERIQQIFTEAGVPRNAVRWVFAPNGWSEEAHRFENYYPGSPNCSRVQRLQLGLLSQIGLEKLG